MLHVAPLSGTATQVLRRALGLPQSHGVVFANPGSRLGVIPDSTIRRATQRAGVAMVAARVPLGVLDMGAGTRGNWEATEISLSHRVAGSAVASLRVWTWWPCGTT